MSCAPFRGGILESAIGGELPPAAAAHLAACDACREAAARERSLMERIEQELQRTLTAEPSPALLPRVREEVARAGRRERPWLRFLLPAAVAAAAVFAIALSLRGPSLAPGGQAATNTTPPPPTVRPPSALPVPSAPREAVEPSRIEPPRRPATSLRPPPPPEPEVLVPPENQAALRRFVLGLRRRQIDPALIAAAAAEPPPFEDLKVAPLDIQPLSPESIR